MNAENPKYQPDNLTFFREMIFDSASSAISDSNSPLLESTRILRSIGLIETALWLRLGVEIGFFDKESVADFLPSIEHILSGAWSFLMEANALSSDKWCDFMSDGPGPKFMKEKFFDPREQEDGAFQNLDNSRSLEHLRQSFLGSLLLTSEVIFEPTTMFFLQSIGWDTDEEWESLFRGYWMRGDFRLEDLYIGFANHLQYFEQLPHYLFNKVVGLAYSKPPYADSLLLYKKVLRITSQRVIVNRTQAKERLFKLGCETLGVVYQAGPEWQHVRRSIFTQIASITESDTELLPGLWSDFVGNTRQAVSRFEREQRRDFLQGPALAME